MRSARIGFGICLGLFAAAASACGTASPAGSTTKARPSVPPPAPQPSLPPAPPDGKAQAIVSRAQKAFAALSGYRTQMRFFQKNGTSTARGLYDLAGRPPRQLRIDILEGNSRGTKLLWTGGRTVKARPGGLLSPIVVDLAIDDDRLVSVRGYTLDQTDISALLRMLGDPRGRLAHVGNFKDVEVVTTAGTHLLAGCNKMTARLDATTFLPRSVELGDGRETVFEANLIGLRPQPGLNLEI